MSKTVQKLICYLTSVCYALAFMFLFIDGNAQDFSSLKIVSISTGLCHTLAIDETGTLWAWGDNRYGQLGDGTNCDKISPVRIKQGAKYKNVDSRGYHSLVIDEKGNFFSWGDNE
jgi:alpha-tubulin suppressor-like RCC1 family protein